VSSSVSRDASISIPGLLVSTILSARILSCKATSFDLLLDLILVKVIDSIMSSKATSSDLLLDLVESSVIQLRLRYINLYHINLLSYQFITFISFKTCNTPNFATFGIKLN